jgi:hypothetical protein
VSVLASATQASASGSISFVAMPQSSAYTYKWLPNVSNTNSASGLAPGTYCVTITNPCAEKQLKQCFVIKNCETEEITLNGAVTNTCPGYNYGSIIATSSGSGAPHQYLWSNGKTTKEIKNLAPGQYCVTITTQDGCKRSRCF